MAKVNRNAPCPCGSGKKYKHCCMRADQVSDSRELSLPPREALVLNALYAFGQSERFMRDLADAFAIYWGGVYDLSVASEAAKDDLRRTLEWFLLDYPTGDDQRRIIEIFMAEPPAQYPPDLEAVLQAWSDSLMGLFRTQRIGADGMLDLYDPLQQRELQARDQVLARAARPGDLLAGRLFRLDDEWRLSYMTMLLPKEIETGMVEYVRNAFRLYQDEHPQATWDAFLRTHGYIFNAFLLSIRAEAWRAYMGPGTRFHNPALSRDKLREATDRVREERTRGLESEEEEEAPVRRTHTGIILPGTEEDVADQAAADDRYPSILIPGRDF